MYTEKGLIFLTWACCDKALALKVPAPTVLQVDTRGLRSHPEDIYQSESTLLALQTPLSNNSLLEVEADGKL